MSKQQKVFFMSGFPRAGSTLLMNILNQNPKLHGTATSGVIGSVLSIRDTWRNNDIYRANDENYVYEKIQSMLKYMILGFYEKEIKKGIIPIDKNRGWSGCIDLLEEIFQSEIKIIFPIRNVIDCVISMEKLNRKSTATLHGDNGNWVNEQTTIGRAENFLNDKGIFGLPILRLRELIYRKEFNKLVFVNYNNLLTNPKKTLKILHDGLSLPSFDYDINNIKQTIVEQDMQHGFAPNTLHKIKEGKLLQPTERDLTIFHSDYVDEIENKRYGDITRLIETLSKI